MFTHPVASDDVNTPVGIAVEERYAAPIALRVGEPQLPRHLRKMPAAVIAEEEARASLVIHVYIHPRRLDIILARGERPSGDATPSRDADEARL